MRSFLLAVCFILISSPAFSQQDLDGTRASIGKLNFNLMGAGGRALGMGGAFIAVSDDATAVSWNPAGLAQLKRAEASASGKFTVESWKSDVPGAAEVRQNHTSLNFACFAYPVGLGPVKFVAAASYQRQIETYRKEIIPGNPDPMNGWPEREWTTTGGYDTFSPALGFQLTPEIMVGGTVNLWMNGSTDRWQETQSPYWMEEKRSIEGRNVLAGAMYQSGRFSLGAIARSGLEIARNVTQTQEGASSEITWDDFDMKFPAMFGFGMAVRPSTNLLLAADLDMKPYSKTRLIYPSTGADTSSWGSEFDARMKDITQVRLGAEYLLKSGQGFIPVRVGYRTDPRTSVGIDERPGREGEQIVGRTFSTGLGFFNENFSVDVVYELSTADITNIIADGTSHTVSETNHGIMGSVILHFK